MKSRPRRSHSISSAASDTSEFQGNASDGSSAMASTRSWCSRATTAPSKDDSAYEDDSLEPTGRHHPGHKGVADVKTTRGLTHLVQCTIAKLKKRGGCPVNSIKQDIKENYGFSLTSATNNKRLNSALKNLQKQGTIVKTKRGFKLVPINEARRRRRRRSKGRRRRRVRRRKGRGRRRRKFRRARRKGRGRRRGRKTRRRRRRRRRRSRKGRRRRRSRKGRGRRRGSKRRRRGRKRRRRARGRRHDIGGSNLALSGGRGSPRPLTGGPSRGGIPHIPSRNASKVQSRAPSRLPSRSHSPGRPGFDPRETPPTRSRRSSARASARNSPGPHLMASLDDYDL